MISFSNIDVLAICKELDSVLQDSMISNIYEVGGLLILKVKTKDREKKNLIIERDTRVNLTDYDYPLPKYPSQFILSLRRFLRRRRILRMYQHDFDRIVIFELFNADTASWKLVIELFNKGNYLLIDEENRIIIAKKYLKFKERDLLPKKEYKFPSPRGKNFLEIQKPEFKQLLMDSDDELVRTIARGINISGIHAEEICFRAGVDKKIKSNQLSEEQIENLFKFLKKLRNELLFGSFHAQIILNEDENYERFSPINLEIFSARKKIEFESFNKAVDEFYSKIDSLRLKPPVGRELKGKIEAQEKIMARQLEYIEELKEKEKKYYEIGDLLYNNFNSLQRLLDVIKDALKKGYSFNDIDTKLKKAREEGIVGISFYKKILPAFKKVIVEIENKEIELELYKSIGENANFYYDKGKKAKKKIQGTITALSETEKKLKQLQEEKEKKEEYYAYLIKKPKKKWYEKFRWFISSDDFLVIGGRDASSNEILFNRYLEPHELVFHTDFPGSPLAIIKNPEKKAIPEKTIQETAEFVASYSKAWKETWGFADVFYVNADQVSKSPPSGEYLPKGSFMISGKKNILKNVPTKLAISVWLIESENNSLDEKIFHPKVVSGPISAIINRYDNHVLLRPSRTKLSKGKLAEKVKNLLVHQSDNSMKKWVKLLSIDEIILYLPPGFSEIEQKG
ncbi:MAG: ribosome rescue protein RqcH [Promethearchaeota archaeon]